MLSTCGTLPRVKQFQRPKVGTAVDKIVNCTNKVMYVYGTSGTLIKLAPRELDMTRVKLVDEGVLYVVDDKTEDQLLEIDKKFERKIARPKFFGNGRNNEDIYKFAVGQNTVIPITDNCGHFGDSIYH